MPVISQSESISGRINDKFVIKGTLSRGPESISGKINDQLAIKGTLSRGPYGIAMINGVPLVGNISLPRLGLRGIYYDKTENWNAQIDYIGSEGGIYIYSDYKTETDDQGNTINIPSIKIGDGTTPLIDSPFLTSGNAEIIIDEIYETIYNKLNEDRVLVTPEDRERWDGKIGCRIDEENPGNLILTRD